MLAGVNDSGYKAQLTHSTWSGQAPPPLQRTRLPALVLRHLLLYGLLPTAGGWHDPVHAQIFDHLPVVVEAMRGGKRCKEETRGGPAATRGNRFDEVRAVQGRHRFVAECEGIFHKFNDFGLGFHIVWAFAVVDGVRWFFTRNR